MPVMRRKDNHWGRFPHEETMMGPFQLFDSESRPAGWGGEIACRTEPLFPCPVFPLTRKIFFLYFIQAKLISHKTMRNDVRRTPP